MKKTILIATSGFFLFYLTSSSKQEEKTDAQQSLTTIAFYTINQVDKTILPRIISFTKKQMHVNSTDRGALSNKPKTLKEASEILSEKKGDTSFCCIGFVALPPDEKGHGHINPTNHTAAINASVLSSEDKEKYGRRLERQAMRSFGFLLGLKTCPNPQCVLWPYKTMEQLDKMGRNYCPPCFFKSQEFAKEKGIKIDKPQIKLPETPPKKKAP